MSKIKDIKGVLGNSHHKKANAGLKVPSPIGGKWRCTKQKKKVKDSGKGKNKGKNGKERETFCSSK